jgi:heme exporter protein A
MLSCSKISLKYGENRILSEVSFSLLQGSISIIRGPNGSGKTSLLKSLATIIKINDGEITWQDKNIFSNQIYLSHLCYVGHKLAIKPELTVLENLQFWAALKDTYLLIPASLAFFDLDEYATTLAYELSMGWQKRLALARLMVTNTMIWLLDEPEVNLEPQAIHQMLNLIVTRANQGGIVIIASHNEVIYQNFQQIFLRDFNI